MTKPIVTRFAPSPTGSLHVGGARTALFAWAFAKKHGGQFLLRVEDTDQKRSSLESVKGILRDLKWLGLSWDEGPVADSENPYQECFGTHGPYFQSQNLPDYQAKIEGLIERGLAYHDDGAVRFKMGSDVSFVDAVYGEIHVAGKELEDFVIQKADGFPTYHFAVVVDDIRMQVSHVIRGQEHLINTPKHAALYDAFGESRPVWVHTPSIMNPGGSKMSKRDKAKVARKAAKDQDLASLPGIEASDYEAFLNKKNDAHEIVFEIAQALKLTLPEIEVSDFRDSGYRPVPLLNYLALLGWNPKDGQERFDMQFISDRFNLEGINRSNATFDREKLFRFNAEYLAALPASEFSILLKTYFEQHHQEYAGVFNEDSLWQLFCAAYQVRCRTLAEAAELGQWLLMEDTQVAYDMDHKAVRKAIKKGAVDILAKFMPMVSDLPEADFAVQAAAAIERYCEQESIGMGRIGQPIRIALTGALGGPHLGELFEILGKTRSLLRLNRFVECDPQVD